MAEIEFGPGGALVIPREKLGALAGADPAAFRLVSLCDDLLVCRDSQAGNRSAPLLYGDLRLFHVAELMALITSMRKDGVLTLSVPHARKVTCFQGGEVIFATSTVEDDRLGEVLWRRGYLALDKMQELSDMVVPSRKKLGKLLIDRGVLSPRQLYEGIKEQVLEIVYSTFHFSRGEFLFVEGKGDLYGSVRLDLSTRDIIREGVRRLQELSRLEELMPDPKTVLFSRPVQVEIALEEPERHLLTLIDGRRTVADLIVASRLGEFDARKALAKLLQVGSVQADAPAEQRREEEAELSTALQRYKMKLRRIHQTLKVEAPGSERRLEEYPTAPPPKHADVFKNVGLDREGKLDVDTLLRNARRVDDRHASELVMEALRALYDYAVFQAMDVLDDDTLATMNIQIEAGP